MPTKLELSRQAMLEIGVTAPDENLSAQDFADVGARYEQRLVMLQEDNYADFEADDIPDAAMPGLIRIVAYEIAPMFGVNRKTLVEANGDTWEDRGLAMLRRYMRQKPDYEATRVDYF